MQDPDQNAADLQGLKPDLVKELHQIETSATIAIVKARCTILLRKEFKLLYYILFIKWYLDLVFLAPPKFC